MIRDLSYPKCIVPGDTRTLIDDGDFIITFRERDGVLEVRVLAITLSGVVDVICVLSITPSWNLKLMVEYDVFPPNIWTLYTGSFYMKGYGERVNRYLPYYLHASSGFSKWVLKPDEVKFWFREELKKVIKKYVGKPYSYELVKQLIDDVVELVRYIKPYLYTKLALG